MTKKTQKRWQFLLFAALFPLVLTNSAPQTRAQGGPPMLTDDPGTPGNRNWEVNFLSAVEHDRRGSMFEVPNIDVNYGVGNSLQIKFEAPLLISKQNGENMKTGAGNSMFGVKWRFLNEERDGVDVSVYPQVEFNNPSDSIEDGLVERGAKLFLPIEAAKKVGPVEVDAEFGYRLVEHGTDELEYGVAVARQITRRFELIGEIHGSSFRNMRNDELLFNVGTRTKLGKNLALLFSVGRTIRSPVDTGPKNFAAFGLQVNFSNRILTAWRKK